MFLFLQAAFGGQCGGLHFSIAAHFSYLSLMSLLFLQAVFGRQGGCILLQKVFRVGHCEIFLIQAVLQMQTANAL